MQNMERYDILVIGAGAAGIAAAKAAYEAMCAAGYTKQVFFTGFVHETCVKEG